MRFWLRELAGWLLVVLGLYLFLICAELLLNARWVLEPVPLMIIGIIVFRGGIHLLKVAVAARICMRAQESSRLPTPRRAEAERTLDEDM